MRYRPLPKSELERIENDFENILSEHRSHWLEGALRESRVHFILRSFHGVLNYDLDNLMYRPENGWKSVVFSIKNRLYEIDFPYEKYPSDFLYQLIFNKDHTEFQVADVKKNVVFTGDREELERWTRTLLFEEWRGKSLSEMF